MSSRGGYARRAAQLLAGTPFALGAAVGCATIVGIPDRVLERDAVCSTYCDAAIANCTGPYQVYESRPVCLGTCNTLALATDQDSGTRNTIECRTEEAVAAKAHPDDACRYAGPAGGVACAGDPDSDCESYCRIVESACPSDWPQGWDRAQCTERCRGAFRPIGGFSVSTSQSGDTLACRIYQASEATVDPSSHCDAAELVPTTPCIDPGADAPSCEDYCRVIGAACTDDPDGDWRQYESDAQCLATCAAFARLGMLGTNADTGTYPDFRDSNTVGCRKYHAYRALTDPRTHCPHAGPTGDGYCGDDDGNCQSYCGLVSVACPTSFATTFGDLATCMSACAGLQGVAEDSLYDVSKGESAGPGLACRMLAVTRALANAPTPDASADDPPSCAAALGQALPCTSSTQ